ncbi:hypothetical protein ACGFI4_25005 [Micromonospora carbonacea]|uniref:hypothetical protein n=1 Tax=Micromonospora carbonacea TaxID=47853 RepID=UPI003715A373
MPVFRAVLFDFFGTLTCSVQRGTAHRSTAELLGCPVDALVYLSACGPLGLAPGDCLYVGDGGSQELTGARRAGMTAVRLAAPDLAGHMVFNAEPAWDGPELGSLSDVLDLVGPVALPT